MSLAVERGDARLLLSLPVFQGLTGWSDRLLECARRQPGFQESEAFQPLPGVQDRWVVLIRFGGTSSLRAWLDSPDFVNLNAEAERLAGEPPTRQVLAGSGSVSRPVSLVVGTKVDASRVEAFRAWQAEMLVEEQRLPGFLEGKVIEPLPGVSDEWTIVVKFDSTEHLDAWMESEARHRLMERIDPALRGDTLRKVSSSFEGWFGVEASTPPPPDWKQALSVLVGLYPLVMLDTYFLFPQISGLPVSIQVLVVNMFNLSVLTWIVMPRVTRVLKNWLYPPKTGGDALRTAAVLGFLAAVVAFFSRWSLG